MLVSMSWKGDCYDAVAESFFATLEFELITQHDWHSRDEARGGRSTCARVSGNVAGARQRSCRSNLDCAA